MRRAVRSAAIASACACMMHVSAAAADEPAAPPPAGAPASSQPAAADVDLEKDTRASAALGADVPMAPLEAPPPPPYKKTLVLDSSLGAMAFLGQFGKVAPPGPWLHTQLGYELFKWFMVFGEGDLAFTDTSGAQAQPKTRAFPIFGFGGGARFTLRFTERVGVYLQGSLGWMTADVRTNALGLIGYRDAESLGIYAGGRIGLEWYQLNRHFALGLTSGIKHAGGFQRVGGASDTPLAFDAGVSLRYAF